MYKSLFFALLIGFALFNSACNREDSSSVEQDRIWQLHEIAYDAETDKTIARSSFKFSNAFGTALELVDNASAEFNNDLLDWKPVLAHYEREYAGVVDSGTFVYNDLDGNTFTNVINPINPIAFSSTQINDTIFKSAAYELFWDGIPLEENEYVILTVNGDNEGDARIVTQTDIGASSIIIGTDKLEALPEGMARIEMERVILLDLDEGNDVGGNIQGKYKTAQIEVMIRN